MNYQPLHSAVSERVVTPNISERANSKMYHDIPIPAKLTPDTETAIRGLVMGPSSTFTGRLRVQSEQISIFVIDRIVGETYYNHDTAISNQTVIAVTGSSKPSHSALWKPLLDKLSVKNSKLRSHGAQYLLYSVLDCVVRSLEPVIQVFHTCVESHQLAISNNEKFELGDTLALKRELQQLLRVIRPTLFVLRHCIDDQNISDTVSLYLQDINDHLMRIIEDIQTMIDNCTSIREEIMHVRNGQMNKLM